MPLSGANKSNIKTIQWMEFDKTNAECAVDSRSTPGVYKISFFIYYL